MGRRFVNVSRLFPKTAMKKPCINKTCSLVPDDRYLQESGGKELIDSVFQCSESLALCTRASTNICVITVIDLAISNLKIWVPTIPEITEISTKHVDMGSFCQKSSIVDCIAGFPKKAQMYQEVAGASMSRIWWERALKYRANAPLC